MRTADLPRGRVAGAMMLVIAFTASAQSGDYTVQNLGIPDGANSAIGVRMNNLGQVAGWSSFDGLPRLRGWVWTPGEGFTVLPALPSAPTAAFRAMDISDTGIVGGDGGFDSGLAFRYEGGVYTQTGGVDGLPIAYLGGINDNGDLAGTAKDASIVTDDRAWLDINGGPLINLTPSMHGRAVDVNNAGQVAGYAGAFEAFRWDEPGGIQLLGTLGLARSFASQINDAGQVVGSAESASGNTSKAWIYTDGAGMVEIPAPISESTGARALNNHGEVVGTSGRSGPDLAWLWTGGGSVIDTATLFDAAGEQVNVLSAVDINDSGQILLETFDNKVADFRYIIITPPGACRADLDGDGALTFFDFLTFQNLFGAGDLRADFDGDGELTFFDFLAFQNEFAAGCA
ncbi:MAG: GC-type dockerin domain-anchored protein [Phycisphaerales bacterium JB039]